MSLRGFNHFSAALLVVAIAIETAVLSGLLNLPPILYHGLHNLELLLLVLSQLYLFVATPQAGHARRYALYFAAGGLFTLIGDFVNGELSGVTPVSLKLGWALLWFGVGYGLYLLAMVGFERQQPRATKPSWPDHPLLAGPAIMALNASLWWLFVRTNLNGHDLLLKGSFVFNATIYVAMPLLGQRFFRLAGYRTDALLVWLGAMLIPFSDLILFNSWMRGGDPQVPALNLYAINWVVYFGGQVLLAGFPRVAIESANRVG